MEEFLRNEKNKLNQSLHRLDDFHDTMADLLQEVPTEMTADDNKGNGSPSADGSFGGESTKTYVDLHHLLTTAHTPTLVTIFVVLAVAVLAACCCCGCGATIWLVVKRGVRRQARQVASTAGTVITTAMQPFQRTFSGRRKDMTEEWADPQMQVPMRPIARQYPPAYPQNIPQQVQPNAPERRPQNIGV